MPTELSQQYFKDISYDVIQVSTPDDVLSFPHERFFHIEEFYVYPNDFSLYKERHVSGVKSKTLKVNNYYIAPMYADTVNFNSKIAYGIKFSTSMSNGTSSDKKKRKIQEFNIKSHEEFSNLDLDTVSFFEKQMNSEDAENFMVAWTKNELLYQNLAPVVLVNKRESIKQLLARGRRMTIYSVAVSLVFTLSFLFLIDYFENRALKKESAKNKGKKNGL